MILSKKNAIFLLRHYQYVRVVKLYRPGLIAGNNCDRLQSIEIINGPGIENVYVEVEAAC